MLAWVEVKRSLPITLALEVAGSMLSAHVAPAQLTLCARTRNRALPVVARSPCEDRPIKCNYNVVPSVPALSFSENWSINESILKKIQQ